MLMPNGSIFRRYNIGDAPVNPTWNPEEYSKLISERAELYTYIQNIMFLRRKLDRIPIYLERNNLYLWEIRLSSHGVAISNPRVQRDVRADANNLDKLIDILIHELHKLEDLMEKSRENMQVLFEHGLLLGNKAMVMPSKEQDIPMDDGSSDQTIEDNV